MPIPDHTEYSLTRLRRVMAAEVEASRLDRRAWVAIVPQKPDGYIIMRFEVLRRSLDSGLYLAPGDIHHMQRLRVEETGLEAGIVAVAGDPAILVPPHLCDYPL